MVLSSYIFKHFSLHSSLRASYLSFEILWCVKFFYRKWFTILHFYLQWDWRLLFVIPIYLPKACYLFLLFFLQMARLSLIDRYILLFSSVLIFTTISCATKLLLNLKTYFQTPTVQFLGLSFLFLIINVNETLLRYSFPNFKFLNTFFIYFQGNLG